MADDALRARCFAWLCELPSMDPGGQETTDRLVAFVRGELARLAPTEETDEQRAKRLLGAWLVSDELRGWSATWMGDGTWRCFLTSVHKVLYADGPNKPLAIIAAVEKARGAK